MDSHGTSERKRDKILGGLDKGSFLDRLKKNEEGSEEEEMSSSDKEVMCFCLIIDNFQCFFLNLIYFIKRINQHGVFYKITLSWEEK